MRYAKENKNYKCIGPTRKCVFALYNKETPKGTMISHTACPYKTYIPDDTTHSIEKPLYCVCGKELCYSHGNEW